MNFFVKSMAAKLSMLRAYRTILLMVIVCLDIILYLYLNRVDNHQIIDLTRFLPFDGDLKAYAIRFASSLTLFGIIPVLAAGLLGFKPVDLGLRFEAAFFRSPVFWILAIGLPFISAISTIGSEIEQFYPFSHSLISLVLQAPQFLALHGILYLFCYYLPWEILFRGLMIFPLLPAELFPQERQNSWKEVLGKPTLIAIACVQVFPTVLIHYSHPFAETLGALSFGIIAALLTLRYRTIFPILIIHFLCGFTVDCVIIAHAGRLV